MKEIPFIRRLFALTRKEFYQLLRDKSSLLLGIVMPVAAVPTLKIVAPASR